MSERGSGPADATELIALIDRLEPMLEGSGLSEIELEAGGTAIVLRAPSAVPMSTAMAAGRAVTAAIDVPGGKTHAEPGPMTASEPGLRAIAAPLTGVFYLSPSPGAAPYIKVGGEVLAGQVIGLLEAMKLFNEIKSDVTGVVRTIAAASGDLVKARQTLIEVEPS